MPIYRTTLPDGTTETLDTYSQKDEVDGLPEGPDDVEADEGFEDSDNVDLEGMTAEQLQEATDAAKRQYMEARTGSDSEGQALKRYKACIQEKERRDRNEARAERRRQSKTSERTGREKKKPRGKPFQKGKDPRRNEGDGSDDDEGQDEEQDGEGNEESARKDMKRLPKPEQKDDDPMTAHIRKIAREEDARLAEVIDDNFAAIADELARIDRKAGKGGGKGGAITVRINDTETGKMDGHVHPMFTEILTAVRLGLNVLLVGPAGCGKTTLAGQVAAALSLEFGAVSCSAGMTESALTGRLIPIGEGGRFEFAGTQFTRLVEHGGLFLVDEMDGADANVLLAVNALLANRWLPLPNRINAPMLHAHDDFHLIAAANTYGHGANRMYVGRNQLDAATLNRFAGGVFSMDFDRTLEAALCPDTDLLTAFWAIRDKANAAGLRRIWGTRDLIACYKWRRGANYTVQQALYRGLEGWSADDMTKAGMKPQGAR